MSPKMHTSSSAASGSRQESFDRSILNTLRKDSGFYVSALILLGILYVTVICLLPLPAYEGAKDPGSFSVTFLQS